MDLIYSDDMKKKKKKEEEGEGERRNLLKGYFEVIKMIFSLKETTACLEGGGWENHC